MRLVLLINALDQISLHRSPTPLHSMSIQLQLHNMLLYAHALNCGEVKFGQVQVSIIDLSDKQNDNGILMHYWSQK